MAAAQVLTNRVDETRPQSGTYVVVRDPQGVQVGDYHTQTITFGSRLA